MTGARGFPVSEYRARLSRAQALMARHDLSALLLTTEPEIRYFTGFLTRFWESPSRPWFLVIPLAGPPAAVIPAIGAPLMGQTWIEDIRTWPAPAPGKDHIALLADTITELAPSGPVGLPSGFESHLRLPLADHAALQALLPGRLTDDAEIPARLRRVKSEAEIAKIRTACSIGAAAFDRVPEIAAGGVPLDQVFRRFQMLCLDEGADWVPYLAGGAGPGGYGDVISPATEVPLAPGDVLMLDTGLVHDGYFCDFDRNFTLGPAPDDVREAQARLIDATHAAFEVARPGATHADLYNAMLPYLAPLAPGRLGHGLGMQLTEGPSILPWDTTPLEPGMVLTLEPSFDLSAGRMMVHEENIVIREGAAEWLTPPAGYALPELDIPPELQ